MYNYDEAFKCCVEYFSGDTMAAANMCNKYLLHNKMGVYLEKSPEQVFNRITDEYFRIEQTFPNPVTREEIYNALVGFKYIVPQGSPLFGIGNNESVTSIGNCFVVPSPDDSYGGILKTDHELVQIMKRRGGVGVDISTIRPEGTIVNNAAGTSDGVGLFMNRYSNTTKEVAQNGRRGALMLSLSCMHPDIETFINIKKDLTKVTSANVSVKWTDEFLQCVEEDKEITLRYPVDASIEDAKITKTVSAKKIWTLFVEANWKAAEPGCLFWDTIIKNTISDCYTDEGFESCTVNPCGEIILSPYGACILQVLNLANFVDSPYYTAATFNEEKYIKMIHLATRLMDNMLELEIEKVTTIINKILEGDGCKETKRAEADIWIKIRNNYINGRRVGLGVTGLADMLAQLNVKYGSAESIIIIDKVFAILKRESYYASTVLAEERGAFEVFNFNKEKDHVTYKILSEIENEHCVDSESVYERTRKFGRRNIAINTCSPTGTISTLTQTSSGIEPVFMLSYIRNKKMTLDDINTGIEPSYVDADGIKWTDFQVVHHGLVKWRQHHPDTPDNKSPYFGCTAQALAWEDRVETQSTIQKYIDHSISSTVNLDESATVEDISGIYLEAWRKGCKGITIYRDGSRTGVLISKKKSETNSIKEAFCPKRSKELTCDIHYSNVLGKQWVFFVGIMENQPYDIFGGQQVNADIPKKYKTGKVIKNGRNDRGIRTYDLILGDGEMIVKDLASAFSPDVGTFTRIISTMLRHGIPIKYICEQLHKINPESEMWSFEKSTARVLKKYVKEGESSGNICPDCQQKSMVYKDGCCICLTCGYSACS